MTVNIILQEYMPKEIASIVLDYTYGNSIDDKIKLTKELRRLSANSYFHDDSILEAIERKKRREYIRKLDKQIEYLMSQSSLLKGIFEFG